MNTKFKNSSAGDKAFIILVYVLLSAVMLIVLYPLIYIVSASFSDPQAVVSGKVMLWPVDVTLRGYKAVFRNPKILTGFMNSFIYMGVGTVVNLIMTMLCAYPLSRKEFTARNKIAALFVFTMYFSGGLMPTYMIVNKLGLINTRWAMIIPSAMSTYNMIIARTYMVNSIPDELYEAAQIDGASQFQIFFKIVLPLGKPILIAMGLLSGLGYWNDWTNGLYYIRDTKLYGIQNLLNKMISDLTALTQNASGASTVAIADIPSASVRMAIAFVAMLPILCLYPFLQRYFTKGIALGAVKG